MRENVRVEGPGGEGRGEQNFDEREEPGEVADHVVIDGMVLCEYSNIRDLRAVGRFLHVSQAGSSSRLQEVARHDHQGTTKTNTSHGS